MTALWLRTTLRKQLLGHPRAMPGVWGRIALHRILPRKEFMGSETYRATFGGALASRELGFGRSGSDRYLSLHCGLVTRVSGRTPFGAYCPKRSLAREASTLSLATCLPGFPGVVLIPLGRLSTSPIPLLARVALWFHHPHLRAGYIHARRISESSKAVAIA